MSIMNTKQYYEFILIQLRNNELGGTSFDDNVLVLISARISIL